jgi:signal transduction histidine kinase
MKAFGRRFFADLTAWSRALLIVVALGALALVHATVATTYNGISAAAVVALAVGIACGEAFRIDLAFRGGGTASFGLGDAALTVGLLLAAPIDVVLAAALAMIGWQVAERVDMPKFVFNVAQYTAGAAAAALIVHALAPRPGPVSPAAFVAVVTGLAIFLLVNLTTVSGMIAASSHDDIGTAFRRVAPTAAMIATGNAGLGLLFAVLADTHLWTLPALAIPFLLLHAASRHGVRATLERERSQALVAVEQQLGEAASPEDVCRILAEGAAALLGCNGAVWHAGRWVTPVPKHSGPCPVDADLSVALVARGPGLGPAVVQPCAAIGLGQGVLVVWPGELGIGADTEEWLERLGRSGRASFGRVAAYMALEQERATLRAVVDGTVDGILLLDRNGAIRLWNPPMVRLAGVPADRAVGVTAASALGTGPWMRVGVHDVERPGERVWRVSVSKIRDEERGTLRALIVHDVSTERRVARMKDDMLAVVSHELRTPLTPILGSARLLRRRWERMDPHQRESLLAQIQGRAEHLARLVEDLLLVGQLSTASGAQPRVSPVATDVAALLREWVAGLTVARPTHELAYEGPARLSGVTDPVRLRQIVDNLIDNACKFSDPGTAVSLTLSQQHGDLVLRVEDRGRGIPAEDLHRVFERFERVEDPLHMTTSGAGLGLYIVRELVETLGGEVALDSVVGVGTTVTVRLPRDSRTPAGAAPVPGPGSITASSTEPSTALTGRAG